MKVAGSRVVPSAPESRVAPSARRPWPPLVGAGRVPLLVRARDVLLTLLVWATLFWLLRDALALAWEFVQAPAFQLANLPPPDWAALWARLLPFVVISGLLVLWLVFWALLRRPCIQAVPPSPQPPALPTAEQTAPLDLDAGEVERWREWRVAVVEFDAAGRATSARPGAT